MQEKILHFIWKYKLFDTSNLYTGDGQKVEVFKAGTHNNDTGGPDFFNAHIKIGSTHWHGNVEIHVKSSDWLLHKHQFDKAYDSIVLHVVWDIDKIIYNKDLTPIPDLCLSDYVDAKMLDYIRDFHEKKEVIACKTMVKEVPHLTKKMFFDRLLVNRIQRKTNALKIDYDRLNKNWDHLSLLCIARVFGLLHNVSAFENLVYALSLENIYKNADKEEVVEALVFGQAGFLSEEYEDKYPGYLKSNYLFYHSKYNLQEMDFSQWQWFRIRPASFPSLRLAQFSALLFHRRHLFSLLLNATDLEEFYDLFSFPVSKYWQNHYHFDKLSRKSMHQLSEEMVDKIVVNAALPLYFLRAEIYSDFSLMEKGFRLLEKIKAEENSVVKQWKEAQLTPDSAYESQALTELYKEYCSQKKCLNCSIGYSILKNKSTYVREN